MMKECEWDKFLKNHPNVRNTETRMPRILKTDTEESLLEAIRSDSVYGFALCSVRSNPEDIDKMLKVNVNLLLKFKY